MFLRSRGVLVSSRPVRAHDHGAGAPVDDQVILGFNGIDDVAVKVTSAQETAGEFVFCDLAGGSTYVGSIPISSA